MIEHLDPNRLAAFERILFERIRPKTVIITTLNSEYNIRFESLSPGAFRHRDHRFEWTRKEFVDLARRHHCLPVAIVLDTPEKLCAERNRTRADRQFAPHVIRRQIQNLRRSMRGLGKQGFRHVYVLSSEDEIATVEIVRQPLWSNRKSEHIPFDIIGDVHECCDELEELLRNLGYIPIDLSDQALGSTFWNFPAYGHPAGRKAIFLGDLVDRGPRILDVVKLV